MMMSTNKNDASTRPVIKRFLDKSHRSLSNSKENNMYPYFSIVTITRNNRDGFLLTKESVLEQSFNDYEWIIIDGASTDGTMPEVKNISGVRVTYISEPDKGIYDAMNKGLEKAVGKFVVFMNSGDCFASKNTLKTLYEESDENTDFIYGDSFEKYSAGKMLLKRARSLSTLGYNLLGSQHQSMYYRRELIGGMRYQLQYKIAADYDFTARFLNLAKSVIKLPIPLCTFDNTGVSERNKSILQREYWIIQRDTLNISLLRRVLNRGCYISIGFLKKNIHKLYSMLRYGSAN